jgi:hypothetical protein
VGRGLSGGSKILWIKCSDIPYLFDKSFLGMWWRQLLEEKYAFRRDLDWIGMEVK